jgi:hypothetical protein
MIFVDVDSQVLIGTTSSSSVVTTTSAKKKAASAVAPFRADVDVLQLRPFPLISIILRDQDEKKTAPLPSGGSSPTSTSSASSAATLRTLLSPTLLDSAGPSTPTRSSADQHRFIVAPVRKSLTAVTSQDPRISLAAEYCAGNRQLLEVDKHGAGCRWICLGLDIRNVLASATPATLLLASEVGLLPGNQFVFGAPPRALPPQHSTLCFLAFPESALACVASEQAAPAAAAEAGSPSSAAVQDVRVANFWWTTTDRTISLRLEIFVAMEKVKLGSPPPQSAAYIRCINDGEHHHQPQQEQFVVTHVYNRIIKIDQSLIDHDDDDDEYDKAELEVTQRLFRHATGGSVSAPTMLEQQGCAPTFLACDLKQ